MIDVGLNKRSGGINPFSATETEEIRQSNNLLQRTLLVSEKSRNPKKRVKPFLDAMHAIVSNEDSRDCR